MRDDSTRNALELRWLASCAFVVCLSIVFAGVYEIDAFFATAALFIMLRPGGREFIEIYRSKSIWLIFLLLLLGWVLAHLN